MSPCLTTAELVLASGSRYRRELLDRLRLPFRMMAAGVDESVKTGEGPRALVQRLASAKASAVALLSPDSWVIGSDQLAASADRILGKPGGREACIGQLGFVIGRTVEFLTACCVTRQATGESFQ